MLLKCKLVDKTFTEFLYTSVGWSGDKLPVCPYCGNSPYSASLFLKGHEDIQEDSEHE